MHVKKNNYNTRCVRRHEICKISHVQGDKEYERGPTLLENMTYPVEKYWICLLPVTPVEIIQQNLGK